MHADPAMTPHPIARRSAVPDDTVSCHRVVAPHDLAEREPAAAAGQVPQR